MVDRKVVALGARVLPLPLLTGCGSGGAMCQTSDYPAAPGGASGVVHVSAGCPAGSADGSAAHPYPAIQQGVDHAASGDAVLIAPGTYPENVSIGAPIMVIGAPEDSDPDMARVIVQAPAHYAVTVAEGTQGVTVSGLVVVDPIGAGVWVQKDAQATFDSMRIDGAVPDAGQYGYGFLATENSAFIFCRGHILDSATAGLLVSGASGEIMMSTIEKNNGEGGIRVETASATVSIHDNKIDGNEQVGVGVYNSDATLANNTITNTKASGPLNIGDGVVVSQLVGVSKVPSAMLSQNTIQGNARVGVLFSAGALGSVTGSTIQGNGFGAAFAAGLWAQAGAGSPSGNEIVISGNTVTGNQYVGIGLTSGARAKIAQNMAVSQTVAAPVFVESTNPVIGDGICAFDGSFAAIAGNVLQGNGRFGIIFDNADSGCTIQGNTISGSGQFGVVVQNEATAPDLTTNMLTGNTGGPSMVVGASGMPYGVQTAEFKTP